MCEFISWIDYKGKPYFLTNKELKTRQGTALIKSLGQYWQEEIVGHGAIQQYYGFEPSWGTKHECTDFSTPDNFPSIIIKALKAGDFQGLGTPLGILTKPALAEYQKVEQAALAEYQKVEQAALAEYQKVEQAAWAEYEKVEQAALAEYEKVEQAALAEYQKVEQPAFWELARKSENRVGAWK